MEERREIKNIFVDEAWTMFADMHSVDELREELRKHPSVPNAKYLVKDGKVFVFEKLVAMIGDEFTPGESIDPLVEKILPQAFVSYKEAVDDWGIVPYPYQLAPCKGGGTSIEHSYFKATLPGTYTSLDDIRQVYIRLLQGEVIEGEGDFVYRGQPLKLHEPIGVEQLPAPPAVYVPSNADIRLMYGHLAHVTYEEGFVCSEIDFEAAKKRDLEWAKKKEYARSLCNGALDRLWELPQRLRWDGLDRLWEKTIDPKSLDLEDAASIYELFPDLNFLPEGKLCAWFQEYCQDDRFDRCEPRHRDTDFLYYIFGRMASAILPVDDLILCGEWIAYALMQGSLPSEAFLFGRQAAVYETALVDQSRRYATAMGFIARDKTKHPLQGPPIHTYMDMYRIGRVTNSAPTPVTQDLSDLLSKSYDGILPCEIAGDSTTPLSIADSNATEQANSTAKCSVQHDSVQPEPIPMLLFCPDCGEQHIDRATDAWENPPHRSHLCHTCGTTWRPADVPTTGVATIATKGKADADLADCKRVTYRGDKPSPTQPR